MGLGASVLRAASAWAVACLVGSFSCATSRAPQRDSPDTTPRATGSAVAAGSAEGTSLPPPEYRAGLETIVDVRDRATLAELEARGFGLAELVLGEEARTTAELDRLPGFKSIFDVLRADVRGTKRTHPLAKVTSMDGFRLFDERWFSSNEMRFELVGVFNRIDRKGFPSGRCGEVRFVYRLAYETKHAGSNTAGRLPMTLNVVFFLNSDDYDCRYHARWWSVPKNQDPKTRAKWLATRGPLARSTTESWRLKSIETNLQSFRLQSFVHPTLAGHIDYVLRVFQAQGGPRGDGRDSFAPAPMENMPDVSAIEKDPELRKQLLTFLKRPDVLASIDRGVVRLLLPQRSLAKRAVSVSPRGLSREANRPFRRLFKDADFADTPLTGMRTIATPAALLRRLDAATCTGCHQSRSIAGFHHVGEDAPEHPTFDALLTGSSAHLESDLVRRRAYVASVAEGKTIDEFLPMPERQGAGNGFGAPCGLGDPGFADWTCADGFRCERLEDPEVGVCLANVTIGSPCQHGRIASQPQPFRDLVADMKNIACDEKQYCHDNRSGFPLGACEAACDSSAPGSTCADFLDADAFQNCLRSRKTFDDCAKEHVYGTGLRVCDAQNPCRQDYVCIRSRKSGVGACAPPYFVYQLRLDGYPLQR